VRFYVRRFISNIKTARQLVSKRSPDGRVTKYIADSQDACYNGAVFKSVVSLRNPQFETSMYS
jgi:hypothetical protein